MSGSTLPLTMTVPEAGKRLLGLGRGASYAAAESGTLPTLRIGRRLVVPTARALAALGLSDALIADALGLSPESANGEPATGSPSADIRALTKSYEGLQNDTPLPACG